MQGFSNTIVTPAYKRTEYFLKPHKKGRHLLISYEMRRFFVCGIINKKPQGNRARLFPADWSVIMSGSFVLYQRYQTQFELLTMEQRGQLITAIFMYADGQKVPEMTDAAVKMAFSFIAEQLDYDKGEYKKRCKKNSENIAKRWGKSEKNDTTVYERIPNDTTVYDSIPNDTTAYLSESDSVSVSESDSESDSISCCKNEPKKKGSPTLPYKKSKKTGSYQQARVGNSEADDPDDYENNEYFQAALARSHRFLREVKNSEPTPPSSA